MNKQINTKTTKLVRIDSGYHKLLKLEATRQGKTIKGLLEEYLVEFIGNVEQ